MTTMTIDGAEISYLKEGSGQPLILLHSLGGSAEMWRRTIDDLQSNFTVIAPDARGHGLSPANGEITVERFAKDAIAIASALKLPKYGVLGLSMGGQAAIHVAADDPDRVTFLIAADTSLGAATKNPERVEATRKRIAEIGARAFALEYTKSRLRPNASSATIESFAAMVMHTLPNLYVTQLASILAQDVRPRVGAIRCPTLIVVGSDDVSTPPATAETLCRAIDGARLQIIADANHLSNLDQPEAFNTAVQSFVAGIARI
jgi:3-oxoadipate enol-lactonase